MKENKNLIKAEMWFDYYKKVYNIFKQIILHNNYNKNFSIELSFFNSVPMEDDYYNMGQIVKLELFENHKFIYGIALKTIDNEEALFQYVWLLVVNHFISENYTNKSKIKTHEYDKSTRSFKYLLSDITKNNNPIARANFTLTYNKQEYDNMLHYLILNHNNNHDNDVLIKNVHDYIVNNMNNPVSTEFDNSIKQSKKVYEHLIHNNVIINS